jgi:hypothetical protein
VNNPEYILTDEMATLVDAVKASLGLPVLNYQHGYVDELKETLVQYGKTEKFSKKKYPLVWLVEPFTVERGDIGWYGTTKDLRIFIIAPTDKDYKAQQRIDTVFKPVLYPIYRELLEQFALTVIFKQVIVDTLPHNVTNRYFWGEEQQKIIGDIFDCMELSNIRIKIANNPN